MSFENGEHYVQAAGARLWTIASGVGTPVVFFSGGPGCDDYLGPVAQLIEDRCRIVRCEPRGCGRSDWDGRYDVDTFLADVEALRAAYGYDRWLVLGHSHGVNLALAYALQHPARVRGIIGIAGGNVLNDRVWSETYHERRATIGEDLGGKVFHADAEVNRQGNESWRSYCRRPTLFRELAELSVPCVFISGAEDIRPNWPTQQLAALIPSASYIELPGAAHAIWLTHARELQEELHRALASIP